MIAKTATIRSRVARDCAVRERERGADVPDAAAAAVGRIARHRAASELERGTGDGAVVHDTATAAGAAVRG